MYGSAAARTAAVREFVHAEVVLCIGLGFPRFYDPPPYRGPGTAHFDARRLSSLALGPVFADEILCRVGRAWRGRATEGGRMALGRAVPQGGILKPT